jgi:hypothetical protein
MVQHHAGCSACQCSDAVEQETVINPEQLADALGVTDLEWWADEIRHDPDPAKRRLQMARSILEETARVVSESEPQP